MIQKYCLKKKTFAVDIDGTITLNGKGSIHLEVQARLRSLKDEGHGGCITFGDKIQHKMLGNKGECVHALATIQSRLDIEIKEKPVFPRMTEVVLERTFQIEEAQKIVDRENLNVILSDSGYGYHINSKGVNKGSGFLEAIKILDVDLNDVIAIGDSETDIPLFKIVENSIAVSNSTENLKKIAKIVTTKKSGEGVLEGLDSILSES